jgi:hypothetical protein
VDSPSLGKQKAGLDLKVTDSVCEREKVGVIIEGFRNTDVVLGLAKTTLGR